MPFWRVRELSELKLLMSCCSILYMTVLLKQWQLFIHMSCNRALLSCWIPENRYFLVRRNAGTILNIQPQTVWNPNSAWNFDKTISIKKFKLPPLPFSSRWWSMTFTYYVSTCRFSLWRSCTDYSFLNWYMTWNRSRNMLRRHRSSLLPLTFAFNYWWLTLRVEQLM